MIFMNDKLELDDDNDYYFLWKYHLLSERLRKEEKKYEDDK